MQRPLTNSSKPLSAVSSVIAAQCADATEGVNITGISQSSSDVISGDLFIALPGEKFHGAQFASDAIARGAVAVLTDSAGAAMVTGVPVLVAENPRRAAGVISAWLYEEPMRDLYSIGVTGTNGKTTVTTLLHQIMQAAGRESGLIGTVETRIGSDVLTSKRTTPESADLQALCAVMRERHMRNLIMEVSSHAISLERVRGSHFAVVGFTNLSQDHLDFHKSMEEYFQAKARLFTFEYADLAVINIDDVYGARLAVLTELPVLTLSRNHTKATWHYSSITRDYVGASVAIRGSGGILIESKTTLHGGFNYDNLLMAVAIAVESGVDPIDIAAIMPRLTGAAGRLEAVHLGQSFTALVDYAHSPDAVARVLETVHEITQGNVIAVLGCGGDRDTSKRSLMGIALRDGADIAIYTSDNPRSEKPEDILVQMVLDIDVQAPNEVITDRAAAIKAAVNHAQSGDVVIVLGKGHEKGQEIAGVVHSFDDRIELARAIEDKK
ncbi:MAG: UDP-N-acetylmuramoyl-L-alanyl-D-glutamate--2,6-diaminopimelate ligase [Candidatus Planktophila sp.]|nr:UDP-N-acetylmuramoyl-L-alanyl-D-glutamate--2,6-diaminopimelate ligase [Candidatus Planktophila sp.]